MSDHSLKRTSLLAVAFLLTAVSLFAIEPGARYEAGLVYNPLTTRTTLFGGLTATDTATKNVYELNDTWDWNGARWIQLYPAHSPQARGAHAMAWDAKRNRAIVFGGRTGNAKVDLNDTWAWNGVDWTQITTNTSPSVRSFSGMAYDPTRDRMVLYGGSQISSDAKTLTTLHDTWEFDGSDWTQVGDNGPDVQKPRIAWDAATNQMIMVASDSNFATHMYTYDSTAKTWNEQTPAALPQCISGGSLVYLPDQKLLLITGGTCNAPTATEDTLAWDGTAWNVVQIANAPSRLFDAAVTYDQARGTVLLFGGAPSIITSAITPSADLNGIIGPVWTVFSGTGPERRSLPAFMTDRDRNVIWMFAGVNDSTVFGDLWKYQYGQWTLVTADNAPTACAGNASYDTDRQKIVVLCSDSSTFEFDGTTWNTLSPNDKPPARRFSSMEYDPALHKTVLLGGYDGTNYMNETWQWDGTDWTRQSNNPPTYRALSSMWFDPKMQKMVIYGGIGRNNPNDRVTRFSDMWTFDGNGWTQIVAEPNEDVPVDGTPGMRYAAQVAVNPLTNDVMLFGGMRIDRLTGPNIDPTSSCSNLTCVSVYANDWWQWDGGTQKWTQLQFTNSPSARVNAGFAYDPSLNVMTIFGGAAAIFYSDLWTMPPDGTTWTPRIINPVRLRPSR